ncbi:hypothetical protein BDA99DRAFT_535621 [Phascolomyces articulosus]|uniref:Uncharacterized protein n=1 Tax=Phascolomyces articulosus TaxID=60185 RepID=A0AAD5K3P2_9FUNG|nr:hypothetical protein BDA99DRAFT_535621 [Phascolomyces articulosus]
MKKNASTPRTSTSNPLLQEIMYNLTTIRKEVDEKWKKLNTIQQTNIDLSLDNSFVSGSDPGLLVTTCTIDSKGSNIFDSTNRYMLLYALENTQKTDDTSMNVDNPEIEYETLDNDSTNANPIQQLANKDRKTRKLRDKRVHQRLATVCLPEKKSQVVRKIFINIRNNRFAGTNEGPARSQKKELNAIQHDDTQVGDEYMTASICSYCFKRVPNHLYKRNDKVVKSNESKSFSNSELVTNLGLFSYNNNR